MNAIAANQITVNDRDTASAAAKAHTVRKIVRTGAPTGRAEISVGGTYVGLAQREDNGTWSAYGMNDDGNGLHVVGRGYARRMDAAAKVARTDFAVTAYRDAALKGLFGTQVERVERERLNRALAEIDAQLDAEQATDADPERDDDGNVTGDLVDEPEAAAELAATQPAGGCFYCQGELSGRTRAIDYGGHRLTVHEVCVPDTEVFTEGDAPDSTPGKVVDHHGDTTMRQPAAGTVLVRWSRNTVVWTEVSVLRTRAALDAGPASPAPRGVGWHGCRASGRGLARRAARRSRR